MDETLKKTRAIRDGLDARHGIVPEAQIKKQKERAVQNFAKTYTGHFNVYKRPVSAN